MHLPKYRWSAETRTAWKNRQEIRAAKLSRRDLFTMGLLTSGGYLVAKSGLSVRASHDPPESPPTTPFLEPLPIPPVKQPVPSLFPAPQVSPLPGEGRTRPHQALTLYPPQKLYEVHQVEAQHSWHPQLPTQPVWGFDGIVPGPTYHARYGEPILVRNFNDLPQDHVGFGIPQVTTHLHNHHTPSESDGFACDFYPFEIGGPELFYDQHYPNILAGGDIRESLSTLWYHEHRVDFTAENVYKGLAGFFFLFNEFDTGDESTGFRLPSGDFDIPLFLADKLFDEDGVLFFDEFDFDGLVGDKFTVNGKIQPFFQVHPRKYRFRILDGGPSRFYELFLTDLNNAGQTFPFVQITNDGNLLPGPISVTSLRLGVAERADIVIDFAQFAGQSIYLENRLEQDDGRRPDDILDGGEGNLLVRFDVVLPSVPDSPPLPATFYDLPPAPRSEAVNTREFKFERRNGQWAINGEFMDCETPRATPSRGTAEIWRLRNSSGGWAHPIHIHFEEFQILTINGEPVQPGSVNQSRKDVVRLEVNTEVELFLRFRDFLGRHVMHCHNTVHEDHAMMLRFDIV